jgi:hypothetical protein
MPENIDADTDKNANQVPGEGKIPHKHAQADHGAAADPHTEKNLDHGLEETFPASDPVSISPGAD